MQPDHHKHDQESSPLDASIARPKDDTAQQQILSLMSTLGISEPGKLELLAVDPISNSRIPLGQKTRIDPILRDFLRTCQPDQFLPSFSPLVEGMNQTVLGELFPQIRSLLGEYPTGFRFRSFSEKDARELESGKTPAAIEFAFTRNLREVYPPEMRERLEALLEGPFKHRIFSRFAELYREHIEPHVPEATKCNPLFGGCGFDYRWLDSWDAPAEFRITFINPLNGISKSTVVNPYEVRDYITEHVLKAECVKIDDLFQQVFYGTIFPHLIAAGIGLPDIITMKTFCPASTADTPSASLDFGYETMPDKPLEFLRHYQTEFINGAFQQLLCSEFESLCRNQIFPEIAKLPEHISGKFTGLKAIIERQFDFNSPRES